MLKRAKNGKLVVVTKTIPVQLMPNSNRKFRRGMLNLSRYTRLNNKIKNMKKMYDDAAEVPFRSSKGTFGKYLTGYYSALLTACREI